MNAEAGRGRIGGAALLCALAFAMSGCDVGAGGLDRSGGQRTIVSVGLAMAAPAGVEEVGAYIDAVAELSDGSLEIELLSRGETAKRVGLTGTAIIDAVRSGDVPLALLPAREFGALGVRSLDALQAPFVVDSLSLEAELLRDEEVTSPMLAEIDELGVDAIGILPGPLIRPFGITGPLLEPSDFQGATIAVGRGDVAAQTLRLLGAHPVESEFNGASVEGFDGALLQLPAVTGNAYHLPGRSVTANVALWPRPLIVVANSAALAALSNQQRAALHDGVSAAIRGMIRKDVAMDDEAAQVGCAAGLSFPIAGTQSIDQLRAIVKPVVDEIARTDMGAKVFDRIEALRHRTVVRLVCAADPADWPTETESRLDGSYTSDTTADDLRAHGVPEVGVTEENWGHWVLVVKDGRFAFTQENAVACTSAYGVWRMNEILVRTTLEGGGGIAPNGAMSKAGEDFVYRWTEFGGTLKLALAMDEGPDDMVWVKVDDVPRLGDFPARCSPPLAAFPTD